MLRPRVIPCLLLQNGSLIKTTKFKNPSYVGDPINAIRIFNEKEVDELIILDITASAEFREPPFKLLEEIASECFMPVSYGGGIKTLEHIQRLLALGIEKVSINSAAHDDLQLIEHASQRFGSSTIIAAMDVRQSFFGAYRVYTRSGKTKTKWDPARWAIELADRGAGEILLYSIDRDGTQIGYDIGLIKQVSSSVSIPVIACGGAGKIEDFGSAVRNGGASAVAAGSMVVYYGAHRAVLINFPSTEELEAVFSA